MNHSSQSGNVIVLILIGIVLFAALSYAVSRSMTSSGGNSGGEERTNIEVSEILTYANTIATTIQTLKTLNNCTDTQISFENPGLTGYVNPNSPSGGNRNCWVFDPAGGGISYQAPNPGLLDSSDSALNRFGQWYFTGRFCIADIGTGGPSTCTASNSELLMFLLYASTPACEKIKAMGGGSGWAGIPFTHPFIGTYLNTLLGGAPIAGKRMGCIGYTGMNTIFVTVLAR